MKDENYDAEAMKEQTAIARRFLHEAFALAKKDEMQQEGRIHTGLEGRIPTDKNILVSSVMTLLSDMARMTSDSDDLVPAVGDKNVGSFMATLFLYAVSLGYDIATSDPLPLEDFELNDDEAELLDSVLRGLDAKTDSAERKWFDA